MIVCEFCGKPLDPKAATTWRRITGWEKNRTSGEGVHPIKGREPEGKLAHALCLDIHVRGGIPQRMAI